MENVSKMEEQRDVYKEEEKNSKDGTKLIKVETDTS